MSRCRVVCVVGALGDDLVSEEAGRVVAGVGNQRLLEREGEREVFLQPRRSLFLDVLSVRPAANEPEQGVIRVTNIFQTPNGGIVRVS